LFLPELRPGSFFSISNSSRRKLKRLYLRRPANNRAEQTRPAATISSLQRSRMLPKVIGGPGLGLGRHGGNPAGSPRHPTELKDLLTMRVHRDAALKWK
jgi:hypothetical protein